MDNPGPQRPPRPGEDDDRVVLPPPVYENNDYRHYVPRFAGGSATNFQEHEPPLSGDEYTYTPALQEDDADLHSKRAAAYDIYGYADMTLDGLEALAELSADEAFEQLSGMIAEQCAASPTGTSPIEELLLRMAMTDDAALAENDRRTQAARPGIVHDQQLGYSDLANNHARTNLCEPSVPVLTSIENKTGNQVQISSRTSTYHKPPSPIAAGAIARRPATDHREVYRGDKHILQGFGSCAVHKLFNYRRVEPKPGEPSHDVILFSAVDEAFSIPVVHCHRIGNTRGICDVQRFKNQSVCIRLLTAMEGFHNPMAHARLLYHVIEGTRLGLPNWYRNPFKAMFEPGASGNFLMAGNVSYSVNSLLGVSRYMVTPTHGDGKNQYQVDFNEYRISQPTMHKQATWPYGEFSHNDDSHLLLFAESRGFSVVRKPKSFRTTADNSVFAYKRGNY